MCGYNNSWDNASYSDPGSDVTGSDNKNHGVTKVGQPVLLSDVNSIGTCSYIHIHKLHINKPSWKVMGNIDMNNLLEHIKPMIQGEGRYRKASKSIHILIFTNTSVGKRLHTSLEGKYLVVLSLA